MARLQVMPDPTTAGRLRVDADNPAALAAVGDALVRSIGGPGDALACWALHPHEQDELRERAYLEERGELGQLAVVDVVELARPRQENVVWIDRFHLVARAAPPTAATRLLGLYVGTRGELALFIHDASVTGMIAPAVAELAPRIGRGWDDASLLSSTRIAIRYSPDAPTSVDVRIPHFSVPAAISALHELRGLVSQW